MVGAGQESDYGGMDEQAPLPTAADRTPGRLTVSQPGPLAALTVVAAYPASLVAGIPVALAVFKAGSAAEGCGAWNADPWCGMSSSLAAVGASLAAAAVANLGVAGALIRRFRPAGQRLRPLAAHIAGTILLTVVLLARLSKMV